MEQLVIAAAVELLKIHVFAVLDGQLQPFRQGVYDRRTDTVQTAGNFISAAAELTAGMENGIHDSCRRDALFRVNAYRNTASVIGYANDISGRISTVISVQNPANASSMELSTIS